MTRPPRTPTLPAALLALLCACGPPDRPGSELGEPAGEVLAEARHDFRDDHGPGRIVAEIGARLLRTERGAARLVVEPSAQGPLVHPVPGFRGVRGHNHRTARELEGLLDDDALEIVTRPRGAPDASGTRSRAIGSPRIERLAERRRREDGTIDHAALGEPRLVGLTLTAANVAEGEWTSTLVVRGRPRLAVDYRFDGARGAILAVRPIDEAPPLEDTP